MSLRPSILDPLFAPASTLPGVGPKIAPLLDRLLGEPGRFARVADLLFHLPSSGISREMKGSVADAPVGEPVTLPVSGGAHRPPPPGRRAPYGILVEDETGDVTLIFFNGQKARLEKLLPVGERRYISGKIELWEGRRQMVHPDRILDERGIENLPAVEAVYGLTEGLSSRMVGRYIGAALDKVPPLPEWQDAAWLDRNALPDFQRALFALHRPDSAAQLSPDARPALRAHGLPDPGRGGHSSGPHLGQEDAAAPPGRRRLGQDRGRAPGHGERHRGRATGRHDGPHRNPRPPALRAPRAHGRAGRLDDRAAHGPR